MASESTPKWPPEIHRLAESLSLKVFHDPDKVKFGDHGEPANDFTARIIELMFESDRGCVLIAAAWIDDAVAKYLKESFEDGSSADSAKAFAELSTGFKAPLSDAWARETLLLAIGAIDKRIADSLRAVRRLRNKYAHQFTAAVLTDHEVDEVMKHLSDEDRTSITQILALGTTLVASAPNLPTVPQWMRVGFSLVRLRFVFAFAAIMGSLERAKRETTGFVEFLEKMPAEKLSEIIKKSAKKVGIDLPSDSSNPGDK